MEKQLNWLCCVFLTHQEPSSYESDLSMKFAIQSVSNHTADLFMSSHLKHRCYNMVQKTLVTVIFYTGINLEWHRCNSFS